MSFVSKLMLLIALYGAICLMAVLTSAESASGSNHFIGKLKLNNVKMTDGGTYEVNHPFPTDLCVINEVTAEGKQHYAKFACQTSEFPDGRKVTNIVKQGYGEDSTCQTAVGDPVSYDPGATAGEFKAFNCDGKANYAKIRVCEGDDCKACCESKECSTFSYALKVCTKVADKDFYSTDCGGEFAITMQFSDKQCGIESIVGLASSVASPKKCVEAAKINGRETWMALDSCYSDNAKTNKDTLCAAAQ